MKVNLLKTELLNVNVYLCGSHASGKSTLARYIANKYNLPLLTEVARSILSEEETTLKDIRVNIDKANSFQEKVFLRQLEMESKYDCFVSDRSIDCLAYTANHTKVLSKIVKMPEYIEYIEKLKQKKSIIFFIRPAKETLAADGVREELSWEGVTVIDGMIKFILEMNDIPYIQINTANMQERVNIVDTILSKI